MLLLNICKRAYHSLSLTSPYTKQALVAIFGHMRKIRNCQHYPMTRGLSLIEAISRDLREQLDKVSANANTPVRMLKPVPPLKTKQNIVKGDAVNVNFIVCGRSLRLGSVFKYCNIYLLCNKVLALAFIVVVLARFCERSVSCTFRMRSSRR